MSTIFKIRFTNQPIIEISNYVIMRIFVRGFVLGFLVIQLKRLTYWVEWHVLLNPNISILLGNVKPNSISPRMKPPPDSNPYVWHINRSITLLLANVIHNSTISFVRYTPKLFHHPILSTKVYLWYQLLRDLAYDF